MKIKEVEQRTGIGRSNIHYYEKEGLLAPVRNHENNYREYTEEDVQQLKRIKVLRMMGVSPDDVKLLLTDKISLDDVMEKRLEELEHEVRKAQSLQKVCENIIESGMDVYSLDEDVLVGDKEEWSSRLQKILEQDIVKEVITRKQLNKHIMLMLVWGYFINVGITFFLGTKLIHMERAVLGMKGTPFDSGEMGIGIHSLETSFLFFGYVAIVVICGIAIHCTASVKSQIVIFHISALNTSPLIIECSRMFGKGSVQLLKEFTGEQLAVFWIMMMIYVLALYFLSLKWDRIFTSYLPTLGVGGIFLVVYVAISYILTSYLLVPVIAFAAMTGYIAFVWTLANVSRPEYNRYWAVVTSCKLMNIVGTLFGQQGRGRASAVLK